MGLRLVGWGPAGWSWAWLSGTVVPARPLCLRSRWSEVGGERRDRTALEGQEDKAAKSWRWWLDGGPMGSPQSRLLLGER